MARTLDQIEQDESGGRNVRNATGPGGTPESTASGPWQMISSTYAEGRRLAGLPPGSTLAMNDPIDEQRQAAQAIYARYGDQPWAASAGGGGRGTMADDQSNYPPPYTGSGQQLTPSQIFGLLGIGPQQRDDTPQSFISKLGEALGGGGGALTGADRESAGLRALSNLGIGLLSQSGWRKTPTTLGEALGAGLSRAQQSEVESQNMLAASQQARLGAVKDALSILNAQQGQALTARGQDITRASDIANQATARQNAATSALNATTEQGRLAVEQAKQAQAAELFRQQQNALWHFQHPDATGPSPFETPGTPTAPSAVPPSAPSPPTVTPPAPGRTEATPPPTSSMDQQAQADADLIQKGIDRTALARGTQVAGPAAGPDATTQTAAPVVSTGERPAPFRFDPATMDLTAQQKEAINPDFTPKEEAYWRGRRATVSTIEEANALAKQEQEARTAKANQATAEVDKLRTEAYNTWKDKKFQATDDDLSARQMTRLPGVAYMIDNAGNITSHTPQPDPQEAATWARHMTRYEEGYAKPFDQIRGMKDTLDMMDAFAHGLAGTYGGAGGFVGHMTQWLKQAGQGLPDFIRPNMSDAEAYAALSNRLVLQLKSQNPLGGQTSNQDLNFLTNQAPGLSTSVEGRKILSGALRALWQGQADTYRIATEEMAKNRNLNGLQDRLDKMPPSIPTLPGRLEGGLDNWAKQNRMTRGKVYYEPNGALNIWNKESYQ
jgi:hypothetical protein